MTWVIDINRIENSPVKTIHQFYVNIFRNPSLFQNYLKYHKTYRPTVAPIRLQQDNITSSGRRFHCSRNEQCMQLCSSSGFSWLKFSLHVSVGFVAQSRVHVAQVGEWFKRGRANRVVGILMGNNLHFKLRMSLNHNCFCPKVTLLPQQEQTHNRVVLQNNNNKSSILTN